MIIVAEVHWSQCCSPMEEIKKKPLSLSTFIAVTIYHMADSHVSNWQDVLGFSWVGLHLGSKQHVVNTPQWYEKTALE